ncbi:MAG: hypothetical protein NT069_09305 [Planctomycetota bacterium]|nr:hypothetical protein [Planctomycetota bacterium]
MARHRRRDIARDATGIGKGKPRAKKPKILTTEIDSKTPEIP